MEIMRVIFKNNAPRVYTLGDTNLIPGETKPVDKSYLASPDVKEALKKGDLTLIEGGAGGSEKPVEEMTAKELKAYAAEKEIDLTGVPDRKPDILAAIQAAEAGE